MHAIRVGLCIMITGFLVLPATAIDSGAVRITAKKKSAGKRKGNVQDVAGGSTQYKEEYVYYEFEFYTTNPKNAGDLTAKWLVALEGAAGRLRVGTRGEETVKLQFGKPVSVKTEEFKLSEREWSSSNRRGGGGEAGDSVFGYGVQLVGADGEVVAEKFSNPSVKKEYEARKARKEGDRLGGPLKDEPPARNRRRPGRLRY